VTDSAAAAPAKTGLISRYLPIAAWLPEYRRDWLRPDVIAGLTVTALLVPEGMAYAELAGMPPQTAFYAAIPALILYALFGTSKQLVVATSSTIAAMSASVIAGLAPAGTGEFIILTSALAILAGLFSIVAGLFRLGAISQFFSKSVLTGFVFGLALVIAIKQVPKMFGLEAAGGNFWERFYDLIINLPERHTLTLLVGITSLALMLILENRWPKIPAALVTLIYGIGVVSIFNLDAHNVHIIGEIPSGLVPPKLPEISIEQLRDLIPGAIGIALIAFAEAIGPAREFASKYRYRIDADQELIAIGTSNVGAGLFQGYSIGASLSKSAANDGAGAKSGISLLTAAAVTALVALFLTSLFHNLPEATLAAIVIVAILRMMNINEMMRLFRLRRTDFWLAMVALVAVLTFEIIIGLIIAVILSLLVLIGRAAKPKFSILGRAPGRFAYGDVQRHPDYRTIPGLMLIRPDEEVWFANATPLREKIIAQVQLSDQKIRAVLLDLEKTYELDVPSLDMLVELKEELRRYDVTLTLSKVQDDVQELLERSGVIDAIGEENISQTITDGILKYMETLAEFSPEETRNILKIMPHSLELLSMAASIAESEEERARIEAVRDRFEKTAQELSAAGDVETE